MRRSRLNFLAIGMVLFAANFLGCASPARPKSFAEFCAASWRQSIPESQADAVSGAVESAIPITTLGPDDDLFESLSQSSGVVLVDFYADWCGPCRKQAEILKETAQPADRNQASIIKVNVDHHPELAKRLQVSSLPTLLLFKGGEVVERQTGLADQKQIDKMLDQ